MVLFYTPVDPDYVIFMGRDKYENEELIKYGFPEDVWFHVDNLSSAHVYIRLKKGQTLKDIPPEVLEDCAQLVKQNSIQGCKTDNVTVIYTMWNNLKKTQGMDVGQVGFHDENAVFKIKVPKKINMIVNRLDKTQVERQVNLQAEREARDAEERREKKHMLQQQKVKEKEDIERKRVEAETKSYASIMKSDKMKSNRDTTFDDDDFM